MKLKNIFSKAFIGLTLCALAITANAQSVSDATLSITVV